MEQEIENMTGLLELHECESLEEFSKQVYENTENNLVVGYISGYSDYTENPEEVSAIYFYEEENGPTAILQFPFTLEEFNQAISK